MAQKHGGKTGKDGLLTSLGDTAIWISDLNSLEDPAGWLTDRAIAFALELLQRDLLPVLGDSGPCFALLDPSTAFLLQTVDSVMESLLEPHLGKAFLILPLSDATLQDAQGSGDQKGPLGSHWNLLVVDMACGGTGERKAFLFDSLSRDSSEAEKLAERIGTWVNERSQTKRRIRFIRCRTPGQTNGHDCGLHVIQATKASCQMLASGNYSLDCIPLEDLRPPATLRQDLIGQIRALIQKR